MHEPPPLTYSQKLHRMAMLVQWLCRMWTAPVEVWLRKGFGDKYFGAPAAFAVLAVPLFATFFPESNIAPLVAFWWGYFVMLLYARVEMFRRWRRGEVEHTQYNGYSRLHRFFPRMSEQKMKGLVEPMVLIATGAACLTFSPALGAYLMTAGWAMAVSVRIMEIQDRERVLALTDAAFEQRQLAESFRAVFPGKKEVVDREQ